MEVLPTGKVVGGRYRVEELIGEGGMAAVYRVRHAQLDTLHALKVLTLSSKSVQRRLMQEGRVQAAINHPNILSVTDVVDVDGAPGLVMEFIRGPALDDFLLKKPLSPTQVDSLAVPILDGVAAAHGLGLIHRDLKPANVMLAITPHGLLPKVADFGLVKLLADEEDAAFSKTRSGMAMGTPAYMAPEQIRDAKHVDARADVWSLGAILYEMACGRRAFAGEGDLLEMFNRVAGGDFPSLREVAPGLPERMYAAVEAAMTVDREARIATVAELRRMWTGQEAVGDASLAELLSAAQSMGGSEEETAEFLRRSFRSREAYTPEVAVAVAHEVQNAETYFPDEGGKGHDTAATLDFERVGAQSAETLAPLDEPGAPTAVEAVPPSASAASSRRRTGMALVAVGVLGPLVAYVVGYLAGPWLGAFEPTPAEEPVAEVEPVAPAPAPVPRVAETVAPTLPPAPEPSVAPALPKVLPKAVGPALGSGPVRKRPREREPAGTADPAPEPAAEPAPEPAATPSPEAAGTGSAHPTVHIDSDVSVFFVDASGRRADLDALAPGTYTVSAVFDPAEPDELTAIESIAVAAGDTIHVKCLGSQRRCRVTQ